MSSHSTAYELIPLYALDALTEPERHEVGGHLDACPICLQELSKHQAAAASLVGDYPAPHHVWERIETLIESG